MNNSTTRSAVIWISVVFAAGLALGIGTSPRYIEELRVGGGFGDTVDGGSDFERDGDVSTDGSICVAGGVTGGPDGSLALGADTSATLQIDADNDGSETFGLLNGTGTEVAGIDETGDVQIDGDITVSGNTIRSSTGSSAISLSGPNAIVNGTGSIGDNHGVAGEAINLRVINPSYDPAAIVGIHLQTQLGGTNWMSKITTGRSGTWGSFLKLYTDTNSNGGGYAEALKLDHLQNCVLGGDVTVSGNDIDDSGGNWLDSDGSGNTTFAGGIAVTGNTSTLGDASTDTITCTGRMIVRKIDDTEPDTNVAGSQGEIVFNQEHDTFYGCIDTGSAGNATWEMLN